MRTAVLPAGRRSEVDAIGGRLRTGVGRARSGARRSRLARRACATRPGACAPRRSYRSLRRGSPPPRPTRRARPRPARSPSGASCRSRTRTRHPVRPARAASRWRIPTPLAIGVPTRLPLLSKRRSAPELAGCDGVDPGVAGVAALLPVGVRRDLELGCVTAGPLSRVLAARALAIAVALDGPDRSPSSWRRNERWGMRRSGAASSG